MSPQQRTVAILGAAIGGPTLALHLLTHPILKRHFRPVLYDAGPPPSSRATGSPTSSRVTPEQRVSAGATVGLYGNGLHPLFNLGLREEILKRGFEYRSVSVWEPSRRGLKQLGKADTSFYSPSLDCGVVFFERKELQVLLVDEVVKHGGAVHWNTRAKDFSTTDGQTSITLQDGSTYTPDLLVGADGGYSGVRRHILEQRYPSIAEVESRWLPKDSGLTGIYGISAAPPKSDAPFADSHVVWLDRGFLATGPCPNGMTRWEMGVSTKSDAELASAPQPTEDWACNIIPSRRFSSAATASLLRPYLSTPHPYAGTFGDLLTTADRIIATSLRQRVWTAEEIQIGNVVCIGDAARLMLPTSGQGTGFAVEDATVLASHLLRSVLDATDQRSALEGYARERVPRGRKMAAIATFAAHWSVGATPFWRFVRRWGSKWQPTSQDVWPFHDRVEVERV